jgi:toxin ParE1/3/4
VSLPVELDPEARDEFDAGYDYYERRRPGGGESFADAVQLVLHRISANPQAHQVVFGTVRRAVVRRYPYCVYYREEAARVRVVSVFFARLNPAVWQARV